MSQLRLLRSVLRPRISPAVSPLGGFTVRSLSTDAEGGAGSAEDPSPIDPFLKEAGKGLVFGRLSGVGRNTLKTDIIHFLEGCNLSTNNVKFEYNRAYNPIGVLLQFSSPSSYDMATRQTIRKGRLYKLDKIDRSQWDIAASFDGKAVLLQGLPRNALQEDIERFLSGCNFDPSSFQTFVRRGDPDPVRVTLVRFATRMDAMNAMCIKNLSFCLNNPISMRVLQ